jgi:hypothetical protein
MNLVTGIIFGVILPIVLIVILINVFGPKDFWRSRTFEFFLSRSLISISISIIIIGFCFVYSSYWTNPISNSPVKQFFDSLFFIPVLIPFGIGFNEGVGMAFYISVIIEVLILSLFIWILVPNRN